MTSESLVLAANNDQRAYKQIVSAVRQLRRTIDEVAENTAKANAEWHDDPEADDHAAFHASADKQFPLRVRDAAIKELVRFYLAELTLNP